MSYRVTNDPFDRKLSQDETILTRDSCDIETLSTRTDSFDIELQHLHGRIICRLFLLINMMMKF